MYLLYIVFVSFSQKVSLATLAITPLRNAIMQCALPTPFSLYFWCHYPWLPASKIHWKHT